MRIKVIPAAVVLFVLLRFSVPVYGYVVLVVHQQGYTYQQGGDTPSINAGSGTTFDLYLSIATNETIEAFGLDSSFTFTAGELAVTDESAPVDESVADAEVSWTGIVSVNSADNTAGTVTYQKTMGLGESITLSGGQYALGKIEFDSLTSNETTVAPDSGSELLSSTPGSNLFDGFQGCTVNPGAGGSSSSKNCFIATAAYGSVESEEVRILREFRDRYLLRRKWGKALTGFYYRHSPFLAEKIREDNRLRRITRIALKPLVRFCEGVMR